MSNPIVGIGVFIVCGILTGCATAESIQPKQPTHVSQNLQVNAVKPIVKRQILPDFKPPAESSQVLSLRACPEEYESASFVVRTQRESMTIEVKATDLKSTEGMRKMRIAWLL